MDTFETLDERTSNLFSKAVREGWTYKRYCEEYAKLHDEYNNGGK